MNMQNGFIDGSTNLIAPALLLGMQQSFSLPNLPASATQPAGTSLLLQPPSLTPFALNPATLPQAPLGAQPLMAQQWHQWQYLLLLHLQQQQQKQVLQQHQLQQLQLLQQLMQQSVPPLSKDAPFVTPQPNEKGFYVLFVYHLPHNITEEILQNLFGKYGDVHEVIIMRDNMSDPNSRPKGFGFVKYRVYEEAAMAVQHLNGFQLENKRLEVDFKLPKGTKRVA